MGKDCCGAKEEALVQLKARQSNVLKIVLVLNSFMFFVEFTSGLMARSTALLADSKGIIMLLFGVGILAEAAYKVSHDVFPEPIAMGIVGALALLVNLGCLLLLLKHREDDINMKSTWICSRNDIIANVGVLFAAAAVNFTQQKWPDIAIGILVAFVFLRSSIQVIVEALTSLRNKTGYSL